MGFKLQWKCEHCDHVMWSVDEPEGQECPNYVAHMQRTLSEVKTPMSKEEGKERYRIAYHMRGSTWEGVQAYMYQGDLAKGLILMEEAKKNRSKVILLTLAKIREANYRKET